MKNNLLKTEKMMTVVENTAVEAATKFSNYGSEKHRFRNKFVALFICVFLFGTANILAQTWVPSPLPAAPLPGQFYYELASDTDLQTLNNWITVQSNNCAGYSFRVTQNIGTVANPVIQMIGDDNNYFAGYLNGQGNRITVNITSNNINVGLFSCLLGYLGGSSTLVENLVIAGQVTGGFNSENVGAVVGQILMLPGSPAYYFGLETITNLADVTGLATNSSVGGIAGSVNIEFAYILGCCNNGKIAGGKNIGGIVGSAYSDIALKSNLNSGTIAGIGKTQESMGGIAGYVSGIGISYLGAYIHDAVNIGKILSSHSNYSGGLVGYFAKGIVFPSSSAGLVDGALKSVGGVIGYLSNADVISCINTNWVNSGMAQDFGAIVGFNNGGTVDSCFWDKQMCILPDAVGTNNGSVRFVLGLNTVDMLGNNLNGILSNTGGWTFRANLYPTNIPCMPICSPNHPIVLLAAAPIYLQNNERLDNVQTNFFVANFESFPPVMPIPQQIIAPYFYQWGSFDDSVFPWTLIPRSAMQYIDVPPPPSGVAMMNGSGSGWDTLAVRVQYWLYQPPYPIPYPLSYEIIFEKVVPINVP